MSKEDHQSRTAFFRAIPHPFHSTLKPSSLEQNYPSSLGSLRQEYALRIRKQSTPEIGRRLASSQDKSGAWTKTLSRTLTTPPAKISPPLLARQHTSRAECATWETEL
ncbi:hypothetical protein CDAR_587601 [Caerostris darwini]|uniref:Uncharacterized protein n=1 Tax=Caerostris darwini TaxID=1538125 RepID=A0AAV4SKT1_9ARAC|nr:hypothetical protein CDAR_587601 [Caerostris darwini]